VKKLHDWYNGLQAKREYVVKYITIDKLEGELDVDSLDKPDLKISITFGNQYLVEVQQSGIGRSPHSFAGNNKSFSWQPEDTISCVVYRTDNWAPGEDKYLKARSSKDEKYSLLSIIHDGMLTQEGDKDPKIEGSYPIIKLSVLLDGKEFFRPEIGKP
jgi:hypothetical protein